jgi:hypothetical protein
MAEKGKYIPVQISIDISLDTRSGIITTDWELGL